MTVEVKVINQPKHFGVKVEDVKISNDTRSSKNLKATLAELGFVVQSQSSNSSSTVRKESRKTTSFSAETSREAAYFLLKSFDQSFKTDDYIKKEEAYLAASKEVKGVSNLLEGQALVNYNRQLYRLSFDYFRTQILVKVKGDDGKVVSTTNSKVHYRLQQITKDDLDKLISGAANKAGKSGISFAKSPKNVTVNNTVNN